MEYFGAVIIGVVSSLIATALFIIISEVFRRVVLPWYGDLVYRGMRVDGEWSACKKETLEPDKATSNIRIRLEQTGNNLSGTFKVRMKNEYWMEFEITGKISDGFITLYAWPSSRRQNDTMCAMLKTMHRGGEEYLTGNLTMIESGTANIFTLNDCCFCMHKTA